MIKRVSFVRLRRDIPRATCIERWGGEHAQIIRELDGILDYTVDIAADARPPGSWDAVATLRFADAAALERFETDPRVQERLIATRADFAEAVDAFLVDEHVIIFPGEAA